MQQQYNKNSDNYAGYTSFEVPDYQTSYESQSGYSDFGQQNAQDNYSQAFAHENTKDYDFKGSSYESENEQKIHNMQNYQNQLDNYGKTNQQNRLKVPLNSSQNRLVSSFNQNGGTFNPSKPLQSYTIRDVLQLPQQRQDFLKSLPIQNLRLQPEYRAVLNRSNVVLGIADYYEKIIPDRQFNRKVKQIKKGQQIKEVLWLGSIVRKLRNSNFAFNGLFKGKYHLMIPCFATGIMMFESQRAKAKTKELIYNNNNEELVSIALRKFICETNKQQRILIFGQS